MIVLSGAALVLPDRILNSGTLVIDGDRIADVRPGASGEDSGFPYKGHFIVPAFIDVHVHGVEGVDALDGEDAVAAMARCLPRYGVGAFCPTTVACEAGALAGFLDQVRRARTFPALGASRVLPAHLESNFINAEYAGAQPVGCLRSARHALDGAAGADVLDAIERAVPDVAIVTVAPEVDGGMDLVRWLSARGCRVSVGHSGASYDVTREAIRAGARQATHLFNRMAPLRHRAPGICGAVLESDEVAAEIICDGHHVHPAVLRMAVAAKSPSRVLAITDGTAASGLPVGSSARLGGQSIVAGKSAAHLADGTLAGSILTMDGAFRSLERMGFSLVDAAAMCATTPARALGLRGHGLLAVDAVADLVVLDDRLSVVQTYIGGQLVYARSA